MPAGAVIHVPETLRRLDKMLEMNEALVLSSLHQHELIEAAQLLNDELQAEITGRKRIEVSLRESEALSQSVFEANPDCIKIIDLGGHIERMNANGQCLMEIDDFGEVAGAHWPSQWPPESRAEIEAAIVEAQAGRSGHFSGLCPTAKGTPKWWDVVVTAVPGVSDSPVRLIAASRDITERKQAEQREVLLAGELAHRGRNLLSVVQVIVSRTLSGTRPLAEAREVLANRLQALARSQSIVLVDGIEGVPLAETIATECEAFSEQVKADGPKVMMNPKVAQTFALLVHELATNAMKHGALSQPGGRIAICWSIAGAGAGARFKFHWQESGGPPVVAPTRQGFGRVVLEKLVLAEFGIAPAVNFDSGGLRYELDVPLAAIVAAGVERGAMAGQRVQVNG